MSDKTGVEDFFLITSEDLLLRLSDMFYQDRQVIYDGAKYCVTKSQVTLLDLYDFAVFLKNEQENIAFHDVIMCATEMQSWSIKHQGLGEKLRETINQLNKEKKP